MAVGAPQDDAGQIPSTNQNFGRSPPLHRRAPNVSRADSIGVSQRTSRARPECSGVACPTLDKILSPTMPNDERQVSLESIPGWLLKSVDPIKCSIHSRRSIAERALPSGGSIHGLLQVPDDIATPRSLRLIALFREWYACPIDLPGTYYLQVVQRLYKDNQLATGRFVALGRSIDLSMVRGPIFLLAARDDEIVAPEQLLAARHLVGSEERQILGLFMGATTLLRTWSKIARWLAAS